MCLSSVTRFGLGYTVRLWAFGLFVRESITNAGMGDSFGMVQISGKPGENRKYCKISRKELEVRRWESVCPRGRRDSRGVVWCLMDGCEIFVDIYSCDRP